MSSPYGAVFAKVDFVSQLGCFRVIQVRNDGVQNFSPWNPILGHFLGCVVRLRYLRLFCLSFHHTHETRLIGSRYRNTFELYDTEMVLVSCHQILCIRQPRRQGDSKLKLKPMDCVFAYFLTTDKAIITKLDQRIEQVKYYITV